MTIEHLIKTTMISLAIITGILVLLLNPKADNAGPDWLWYGRKYDPIRNLICKQDGSFRKYTKAGLIIWLGFGVILIILF